MNTYEIVANEIAANGMAAYEIYEIIYLLDTGQLFAGYRTIIYNHKIAIYNHEIVIYKLVT